jgi:TetR/AcrR family transcriptional regulator
MMTIGRRERNKEEKRERIVAAASQLFSNQSLDEVTTQQIANAAGIGEGTLFLYAKNKGELLLMVQNAHYADALAEGVVAAADETNPTNAVIAIVAPIVACNRAHAENGRTYLREMAFGDPREPHHARALEIVNDTEVQLAKTLARTTTCNGQTAASFATIISALLLRNLAPPVGISGSIDDILARVRYDLSTLLSELRTP